MKKKKIRKKNIDRSQIVWDAFPSAYRFLTERGVDEDIAEKYQELVTSFMLDNTIYLNREFRLRRDWNKLSNKLQKKIDMLPDIISEINDFIANVEDNDNYGS